MPALAAAWILFVPPIFDMQQRTPGFKLRRWKLDWPQMLGESISLCGPEYHYYAYKNACDSEILTTYACQNLRNVSQILRNTKPS